MLLLKCEGASDVGEADCFAGDEEYVGWLRPREIVLDAPIKPETRAMTALGSDLGSTDRAHGLRGGVKKIRCRMHDMIAMRTSTPASKPMTAATVRQWRMVTARTIASNTKPMIVLE
jgi:hypothetical protein